MKFYVGLREICLENMWVRKRFDTLCDLVYDAQIIKGALKKLGGGSC